MRLGSSFLGTCSASWLIAQDHLPREWCCPQRSRPLTSSLVFWLAGARDLLVATKMLAHIQRSTKSGYLRGGARGAPRIIWLWTCNIPTSTHHWRSNQLLILLDLHQHSCPHTASQSLACVTIPPATRSLAISQRWTILSRL